MFTEENHTGPNQYDRIIEGHKALAAQVSGVVESARCRLSDHFTRVEVYLSTERFIHSETSSGGLLDVCAIVALV